MSGQTDQLEGVTWLEVGMRHAGVDFQHCVAADHQTLNTPFTALPSDGFTSTVFSDDVRTDGEAVDNEL